MNVRERILAIVVGAVLALLAVRAVVLAYTSALGSIGDRIERARKEIGRIRLEKEEARLGMESWIQAGLQTFSMQENEARTLLRDELHRLSAQTGLEEVVVGLLPSRPLGKSGTRVISGKIQAAGAVENLLQFLFTLQNQPYAVRVRKLELKIPSGRDVPKGRLALSAEVETLVLPPAVMVKAVNTVNLAEDPRRTVLRTALAEFAGYQPILDKKMFQEWEPPIPPPPKVAGAQPPPDAVNVALNTVLRWAPSPHATGYRVFFGQDPSALQEHEVAAALTWKPPGMEKSTRYYWRVDAVNEQGRTEGDLWSFTTGAGEPPPPPPQPVVKGPPPDAAMVLSRVLSSPLGQQAVLDNPANRAEARRVEVGGELYGGTLVFVHPTGVVSEAEGQRRFHPLGQPLQSARPLTQAEQPEVFDLVTKLAELSLIHI